MHKAVTLTPSLTPRKSNFIPRAHVSFGHRLGADQKTHGLWERDSVKVVRKYVCGKRICLIFIRWPKRVKHKSVYQNTKQFPKTQINFPKHKSVYQNTNQFHKAQTNFAKHESKDWALALSLSESLEGTHSQDFPRQHGEF